jgi:hypothetical protein
MLTRYVNLSAEKGAARLQTLAQAGTLVIADSTRRQIGTLFE